MATVLAVVFSVAWFPPLALAGEDSRAAKAHYESGVRHFDLSEYESALAEFKEAYRHKPDPALLFNIAQCHRKLGHIEETITFYQSYLRRAPDADNREEVERQISELETMRDAASAARVNSNGGKNQPSPRPAEAQPQPSPVSSEAQQRAAAETAAAVPAAAIDLGAQNETAPATTGAIYKRWWFWTAVGAVAAGTAAVVIILAERDPTKVPTSALGAQKVLP